jgi:2-hydroxychromene-2-carboxylate isomerase
MTGSVDFYFDYGSPNAYLAYRRLPAIAARCGAEIRYRPMLLGGVFKGTGNHSPAEIAAKRPYGINDIRRFARRHDIPFQPNPFFPINTLQLMRGAVAAEADGTLIRYSDAIFDGIWCHALNLGDPAVVHAVLDQAGIDPTAFAARIADEAVKERLKAYTEAAIARGIFGAPSFFVGDELFFGQDRLDFVEEALNGRSYL